MLGGVGLATVETVVAAPEDGTTGTAAPFDAPLCPGETVNDPITSGPSYMKNLTTVFGARLEAYDAGLVVPLYDTTGRVQADAIPPLCGVRYDATTGGPVSEWMLCTDASAPTTVELCGTATTAGESALTLSRGGGGTRWVQSSVAGTTLDKECQVYSLWEQEPFTASAAVLVRPAVGSVGQTPGPPAGPQPTGPSGAPDSTPDEGWAAGTDAPGSGTATSAPPAEDPEAPAPGPDDAADPDGPEAPSQSTGGSAPQLRDGGADEPAHEAVSSAHELAVTGASGTVVTLAAAALLAVAGLLLVVRSRRADPRS